MSYWEEGKTFPVAGSSMTIPWSVAEEAYLGYNPRGIYSQTLLRLAERGGFHVSELDEYVPDWREKASEITALRARVAELTGRVGELEGERDALVAMTGPSPVKRLKWLDTRLSSELAEHHTLPAWGRAAGLYENFTFALDELITALEDRARAALGEGGSLPAATTAADAGWSEPDDPAVQPVTAKERLES